jgi:hypothetical protein
MKYFSYSDINQREALSVARASGLTATMIAHRLGGSIIVNGGECLRLRTPRVAQLLCK